MDTKLVRTKAAAFHLGMPLSTFHLRKSKGLVVPPVSIGGTCVAYPLSELDAINAARIAGKSDDEVRELVSRLVAKRRYADHGIAA